MKSRLLRLSWRISIWDNNRKVQLCGKISITTKCLNGRKKSKINEFSNWKKKDNETVILIFRLSYLYILQIYLLLDFVAQTLCVLKENKLSSQWIPKIQKIFSVKWQDLSQVFKWVFQWIVFHNFRHEWRIFSVKWQDLLRFCNITEVFWRIFQRIHFRIFRHERWLWRRYYVHWMCWTEYSNFMQTKSNLFDANHNHWTLWFSSYFFYESELWKLCRNCEIVVKNVIWITKPRENICFTLIEPKSKVD